MKIVTCTLPNASVEIDGIAFAETPTGMVSEPVADDVAARFVTISGYTVADAAEPDAGATKPGKKAKE